MTTIARPQAAVRASAGTAHRRSWWDAVLMRDLGLVKLHTGLRMLVCVPVGLAVGFGVALLVGLPVSVGLMLGALPAFLTCFIITDDRAGRVAARSAVVFVPFVIALFGSLALHDYRLLELSLMVVLLFLQFYANRFGVWAADFTAVLFAAYLCGLLLPLPLTSFEGLAAVGAASLAATIAVRSLFFRPNTFLALTRTRRAVAGWSSRVVESSIAVLEAGAAEAPAGQAARAGQASRTAQAAQAGQASRAASAASAARATRERKRLHHRLAQLHGAALVADGLLSLPGSGLSGAAAEDFHRLLFDLELSVDGIGRLTEQLAQRDTNPRRDADRTASGSGSHDLADRADPADPADSAERGHAAQLAVAAALRNVHQHGGRVASSAAADLGQWMHDNPPSNDEAAREARRDIHRLIGLLHDLQHSADRWTELERTLDDAVGEPFASSIALASGRVAGSVPILGDTLAGGGMTGVWGRWRISAPLRTAIQAAIAVAIVEPLAVWLGADRFYWGVIGVMVILAGTNSTHERVRKVLSRGAGTVAGGVLGILAVDALGTTHVWLSLALIVVSLAIGAYWFSSHYWVWVLCLVVAICQVYAFAGQFEDALLPLRLAENMLGASVAVIVSLLILPVATGAMISSAVRRQLGAVGQFVREVEVALSAASASASASAYASAPASAPITAAAAPTSAFDSASSSGATALAELPRLRADARAIDQANYGLTAVMKPLVAVTSGGPYRRDAETRTLLHGITASARLLAAGAETSPPLSSPQRDALTATTTRISLTVDAVVVALGGSARFSNGEHEAARPAPGGALGVSRPGSADRVYGDPEFGSADGDPEFGSADGDPEFGSADGDPEFGDADLPDHLRELTRIESALGGIARLYAVTPPDRASVSSPTTGR
ncbi:FUSC family protein [Subtercola endophyticus]|uniref:FUSC family protein n=1 Tax=Subtercola endophyticus TaxID=2895559 RepID=UPI001E38681B|nr:FUSC family protein [Subtercola endophyticus]UFS57919.1 FUSC family protein [Subtercola endophyticus]